MPIIVPILWDPCRVNLFMCDCVERFWDTLDVGCFKKYPKLKIFLRRIREFYQNKISLEELTITRQKYYEDEDHLSAALNLVSIISRPELSVIFAATGNDHDKYDWIYYRFLEYIFGVVEISEDAPKVDWLTGKSYQGIEFIEHLDHEMPDDVPSLAYWP